MKAMKPFFLRKKKKKKEKKVAFACAVEKNFYWQ